MQEATMNTIMTLVVRMKETVILKSPDIVHQYIEWNRLFAEPQVMMPSVSGRPIATGIASCVMHLNGLMDNTEYHVYKPKGEMEA